MSRTVTLTAPSATTVALVAGQTSVLTDAAGAALTDGNGAALTINPPSTHSTSTAVDLLYLSDDSDAVLLADDDGRFAMDDGPVHSTSVTITDEG